MYWLTASGARREPYTLCSSGDTRWGCTAFCNEPGYPCEGSQIRAYPYATNPATVSIETDYLLDVVPQEMGTYFHATALEAQAIAARSYAYWHIHQGSTINNSTQFQAFIPYKFESLNPGVALDNSGNPCASANLNSDQRSICGATASRAYISYGTPPNDALPAFTEFFADIPQRTQSGGQPYLLGVEDPISSHPDVIWDGHGRGMSQKGASRWAQGNRGYQGTLDSWSVRWERADQILVHYYTGIHIRNASGMRLTSNYRWNPLRITGLPSILYHGQAYPINIQVQNSGTQDWTCGYPNYTYVVGYRWAKVGYPETVGSSTATVCGQTRGDPALFKNLTISNIPNWGPGAYTLRFDIYVTSASGNFWFQDQGWPAYRMTVCVDGPCQSFLPAVIKNYPLPTPTPLPTYTKANRNPHANAYTNTHAYDSANIHPASWSMRSKYIA